jgi:hypothetical protein
MEYLSVKQCRDLLKIQSKDTINKYLKTLNLFGQTKLSWSEIREVLKLQIFLGLKHGINSREKFLKMSRQELEQTFKTYGVDINARLMALQEIHRDSVHSKRCCVSNV